jgi:crotonobetainyl-CoA:carnitine CoA-transferase CaiB-like acyl-CoA transferase
VPRAMGNRHPSITPYETLATADRPLVVAVGNDGQFAHLCRVLGLPEAATDPRFASNADRVANREDLVALLEEALAARGAADWLATLGDAGVPCGLVNDVGEAFALAERLGLEPVADAGGVAQVANPIGLSASPVGYRLAPPALGEHTADVLRWLLTLP